METTQTLYIWNGTPKLELPVNEVLENVAFSSYLDPAYKLYIEIIIDGPEHLCP